MHFRFLVVIMAILVMPEQAFSDTVPTLDANGRRLYEAILDSKPPNEIQNDGTGFGLELLRVTGHPRYDKPPNNGSVAEVTYDFKAPAGTKELLINFLIYPDSKSASQILSGGGMSAQLMSSCTKDVLIVGLSHPQHEPFESEQPAAFTITNERALIQFAYQVDRIVITARTDASFPGVNMRDGDIMRDSDKLVKFATNEAKVLVEHALLLLIDGKDVLDQAEIKTLLH